MLHGRRQFFLPRAIGRMLCSQRLLSISVTPLPRRTAAPPGKDGGVIGWTSTQSTAPGEPQSPEEASFRFHQRNVERATPSRRQNAATLKPEEICLASRPRQRAERSQTVDSIIPPPSAGNPPAHAHADVYC
jgi:hypothetical protein